VNVDTDSSGNVYVASDVGSESVLSYTANGALRWQMQASDAGYSQILDVSVVGDATNGLVCILAGDGATTHVVLYTAQGVYISAWQTPASIHPLSVACDPWGYVTLAGGNKVAWFDTAGSDYGSVTVPGKSFSDAAVDDATEETYLVDLNGPRIVKLDTVGDLEGDWGEASGFITLAVDAAGNVYGADSSGHRIVKMRHDGHVALEFGTQGTADGQFVGPNGVAVDDSGNVYIADADTQRMQRFSK
jgi:hypothetical protein